MLDTGGRPAPIKRCQAVGNGGGGGGGGGGGVGGGGGGGGGGGVIPESWSIVSVWFPSITLNP